MLGSVCIDRDIPLRGQGFKGADVIKMPVRQDDGAGSGALSKRALATDLMSEAAPGIPASISTQPPSPARGKPKNITFTMAIWR
jgi:hypothetical protein